MHEDNLLVNGIPGHGERGMVGTLLVEPSSQLPTWEGDPAPSSRRHLLAPTSNGVTRADHRVRVFDCVSPQCYIGLQQSAQTRCGDKGW